MVEPAEVTGPIDVERENPAAVSDACGTAFDPPETFYRAAAPERRGGAITRPWRYAVILLTSVVGVVASIAMSVAIGNWQTRAAELRFAGLARDNLQTINSGLGDAVDLLYSLRAYFESLDHRPSRAEFQEFSRRLRERVVGVRDTGWAPRVTAAGRDAFEREIQATGEPDFQIVERNDKGKMVRAQERAEYFPVLYSDPGEINRPILGFDLTSESVRARIIARARSTDRPAATPPVKLMNMQRPNGGLMSFIPVSGEDAATSDASSPIAGIVLGAFETAPMIENILSAKLRLAGLDVYVFDPNAAAGHRFIYWHSSDAKPAPSEASLLLSQHWQGTLELVDQRWGAIFVPSSALDGGNPDWIMIGVLVAGLVITGSIAGYLWFSLRHTQQLEKLTASLRETTEDLRRNGAKLDHLAHHDALTGLPNRIAFRDEVANGLRRARSGQGLAVLYLDLDRFKAVNDTLGHPVGDQLLCEVGNRLRNAVREIDTIARLGGDEFVVAQLGVEQPDAAETTACRLIDALSQPYDLDGNRVVVGVSVGIALADRDNSNVDQLLRQADMALYVAKREGRGIWRCFEVAMDDDAQAGRGLEMGLHRALENAEFELYYQPLVTIADGRVRGFEALLRWNDPGRGLVLPGDFIQCAEETRLIVPIGAWVLRTALMQAAQWPVGVRVAVNVSRYQLMHGDLVDTIEAALTASGQTGARLELEISENALLEHYTRAQTTLTRLKALGVRISMDDFGTGNTSLGHLRRFPFDRIKIDQSFIAGMTESSQGSAIVRAILQLTTSLGIITTAEGVETQGQLAQLIASGCDEAQGFLFSPPRPIGEVPRLLSKWSLATSPDIAPTHAGASSG